MKSRFAFALLAWCFIPGGILLGQSNAEKAYEMCKQAVRLVDDGRVSQGIELLREAQTLDPTNAVIPYEIAYAHYFLKQYRAAIPILDSLCHLSGTKEHVYQLLGNSYDLIGDSSKAIETYFAGLHQYPRSGRLHLELGVMRLDAKPLEALGYFEDGIAAEPSFPSNYYWASKLFLRTSEKVWGMIYGELFMNLERNSKRTEEMSKQLYDTYRSQIRFTSDSSITISFSENLAVGPEDHRLPLPVDFEGCLALSVVGIDSIDINSLHTIRLRFIDQWMERGFDTTHHHPLFAFQKRLRDLGHFEAYNHWILMQGNGMAFNSWHTDHEREFNDFVKWFSANPLPLDSSSVTVRVPR